MTIGFKQGSVITEIGPGGILHSLFSTIAYHLEGGDWGAKYPVVMKKLYSGSLSSQDVKEAYIEMNKIKTGLGKLMPEQIIWDIEDVTKAPPWGRVSPSHVKSMSDYYVTTTGRNLVNEIFDNLESLKEFGGSLDIVTY
jgi:2,3-bisphosphoglycerate-dependent phosphoglycerate mutase